MRLSVIPAKAGIQSFQIVISLCPPEADGFHRSDDFLRDHPSSFGPFFRFSEK